METPPPAPAGFMGAFRALGDSLLATVSDRLELFSIELQEEKFRLIQTFVWISAALFAGMMAITFASLTLVYLVWESARLAVLGGLAVLY
ncbi:MAG: phage holin family protein, partial [bacterium]|nr:phage holin family protein [bacterium]